MDKQNSYSQHNIVGTRFWCWIEILGMKQTKSQLSAQDFVLGFLFFSFFFFFSLLLSKWASLFHYKGVDLSKFIYPTLIKTNGLVDSTEWRVKNNWEPIYQGLSAAIPQQWKSYFASLKQLLQRTAVAIWIKAISYWRTRRFHSGLAWPSILIALHQMVNNIQKHWNPQDAASLNSCPWFGDPEQ